MNTFHHNHEGIAKGRMAVLPRQPFGRMYRHSIGCIIAAVVMVMLTACGSGGGGGEGGPAAGGGTDATNANISAVGTNTGFGSIYVNGIEFATAGATYRMDDEDRSGDSAALAVGMKVRVKGTISDDGRTGTAASVFYDDDVEGPIDAGSLTLVNASVKTFTIFGLTVNVDRTRTAFDGGANFDTLAAGQKFEVSGFFDGMQIVATRLERQDDLDNEYELRGTVVAYDVLTLTLSLQNGFNAGPFTVSPGAVFEPPGNPSRLFVEARLREQNGDLSVVGLETEGEENPAEGDKISIRGILSEDAGGELLVNGTPFTVTNGTVYEPAGLETGLMDGMEIMVDGSMEAGTFIAEALETGDGDIRIDARVIGVEPGDVKTGAITLDLGNGRSLAVSTDSRTQFVDGSSSDLDNNASFNLDELVPGTGFVEIKAYRTDNAQLVATHIKREDPGEDIRLEASVETYISGQSVTLLGISFTVGGATVYEVNNSATDAANFFESLNTGDTMTISGLESNGTVEKLSRSGLAVDPDPGPTPVPSPTPEPTPDPGPTPVPSPTPEPTPDPGPTPVPTPTPDPGAGLTGIHISLKLDPRLTNSHYLGDRWVSPSTYTRVQAPGKPLTVDARAIGLVGQRQVVIEPEWMPEDPAIVSIVPSQGDQVLITLLSAGSSGLRVTTQGVSKELFVNVVPYLSGTLLVEISQ